MGLSIDTTRPVDRTGNAFCGPLVVAAVLGTSTGNVAAELVALRRAGKIPRRIRSPSVVKGTCPLELTLLLQAHGVRVVKHGTGYCNKYPFQTIVTDGTQYKFARPHAPDMFPAPQWAPVSIIKHAKSPLRSFLARNKTGTFILCLPGHWALLSDGKWCETFTSGNWCDARHAPKRNRNVMFAFELQEGN